MSPRYHVPALLSRAPVIVLSLLVVGMLGVAAPEQPAGTRPAAPFWLVTRDGRQPLATTMVAEREMVALDDLAPIFQLTVREDALARAITVTHKGKTIVLMPDQELASVGGRLVSLPAPPARVGGRWLVPLQFLSRALGLVVESPVDLRERARLFIVGDLRVPRIVGRHETSSGRARVTFDITPDTPHRVDREGTRLTIRFDTDALDVALPAVTPEGPIKALRLADPATTIAIDLDPRAGPHRTSVQPGPNNSTRLTIEIATSQPETAPPQVSPPPSPPAAPVETPGQALGTIAIDPGHGGEEHGARGPGGLLEKDVTLSVARRLKSLIETRLGVRVLLTRDADHIVPIDARAPAANSHKADVLLSLHASASFRPHVQGAAIFYASLDGVGAERSPSVVSERHVLPALSSGQREIELITWEMAQSRHIGQSTALAAILEEELRERVAMSGRGVLQAPLRVLVGANMPAILVELGFLSSAEQERQLGSDEFQNAIAQALFNGLVRFGQHLERERLVRPPAPGRLDVRSPATTPTPPRAVARP